MSFTYSTNKSNLSGLTLPNLSNNSSVDFKYDKTEINSVNFKNKHSKDLAGFEIDIVDLESDNLENLLDFDHNANYYARNPLTGMLGMDSNSAIINFFDDALALGFQTCCSIMNVTSALAEGVIWAAEALVDGVVIIAGTVVSINTIKSDIVRFLITGEFGNATGTMWNKGILWFTSRELTKGLFDLVYTDNLFGLGISSPANFINSNSFDFTKRGMNGEESGVVYEVTKSVGYYAGIIVAAYFTGGAAGAAAGGTTAAGAGISNGLTFIATHAQGIIAGLGALGKSASKNFNSILKTKNVDDLTLKDTGAVLGTAYIDAFIEGVAADLLRGEHKAASFIKKGISAPNNVVSKVGNFLLKRGLGKGGVQFGKALLKEWNSMIIDKDYDWKSALIDGGSAAIVEVLNTNIGLSSIKGWFSGKKANVFEATKEQVSEGLSAVKSVTKTAIDKFMTKTPERVVKEWYSEMVDEVIEFIDDGGTPKIIEQIA